MSRPASIYWPSPIWSQATAGRQLKPLLVLHGKAIRGQSARRTRDQGALAGDCADTLVVSAALPDGGTGLFLVTPTRKHSGDPTPIPHIDGQRGAQIDLESAPAQPLGSASQAGDASSAIRDTLTASSRRCVPKRSGP